MTGPLRAAFRRLLTRSERVAARREGIPSDFSEEEREIVRLVRAHTMTSPERIHALIHAVDYIVAANVRGAIVECGVWRGGSMMAAATRLLRRGVTDRELVLFDTFHGMTTATELDVDHVGRSARELMDDNDQETSMVWARAGLEVVQQNMASTGYPPTMIRYVQGPVEDTLPAHAPGQIALLRLDTDWYESTLHEMTHLFPRLASGGVLIIDDYGHWQGARRAVDEYLASHAPPMLLTRVDYTGRIALKP